MKKSCTLCGCSYGDIYAFKAGYVCENCVRLMKSSHQTVNQVRFGYQ